VIEEEKERPIDFVSRNAAVFVPGIERKNEREREREREIERKKERNRERERPKGDK